MIAIFPKPGFQGTPTNIHGRGGEVEVANLSAHNTSSLRIAPPGKGIAHVTFCNTPDRPGPYVSRRFDLSKTPIIEIPNMDAVVAASRGFVAGSVRVDYAFADFQVVTADALGELVDTMAQDAVKGAANQGVTMLGSSVKASGFHADGRLGACAVVELRKGFTLWPAYLASLTFDITINDSTTIPTAVSVTKKVWVQSGLLSNSIAKALDDATKDTAKQVKDAAVAQLKAARTATDVRFMLSNVHEGTWTAMAGDDGNVAVTLSSI